MASVKLNRSDIFPPGTPVSIHSRPLADSPYTGPPRAPMIASGTVGADGRLEITDDALQSLTSYIAYAYVNRGHQHLRVRSTLDKHDYGTGTATADTTAGSLELANVNVTNGELAAGQRVHGPGIASGARLKSGAGATWQMTAAATATATGVPITTDGIAAPQPGLGAEMVPGRGTWQATVAQRRALAGTS